MKRTIITIKGFDNTKKECIRYVSMPIEVGGKMVHKKVYVFQVKLFIYISTSLGELVSIILSTWELVPAIGRYLDTCA